MMGRWLNKWCMTVFFGTYATLILILPFLPDPLLNATWIIPGSDYVIPRLGGNLGTSENWLYGEKGVIAFTMELCKTFAPTNPAIVLDTCIKHVGVNLYVCERAPTIEPAIKPGSYLSNPRSLFHKIFP